VIVAITASFLGTAPVGNVWWIARCCFPIEQRRVRWDLIIDNSRIFNKGRIDVS
jgi:hypothetical protein